MVPQKEDGCGNKRNELYEESCNINEGFEVAMRSQLNIEDDDEYLRECQAVDGIFGDKIGADYDQNGDKLAEYIQDRIVSGITSKSNCLIFLTYLQNNEHKSPQLKQQNGRSSCHI